MPTLFISDLHLSQERPAITTLFLRFMREVAPHAEALYILGDLFEAWLGDDMVLPEYQQAISAIKSVADQGVPVYIMYGNRDFLMREQFEQMSGASLIHEPYIIQLNGQPTLLLHGDTLCTDDVDYQQFRLMVRDARWQEQLLAKTPEQRLALAHEYRNMSKTEMTKKDEAIMDVNPQAVLETMRKLNVHQLIHG
ncbi:MAG: UDP-2,3-diacylglucosamine diphosphatase, partial [Gammaproteobacteria bacterium]